MNTIAPPVSAPDPSRAIDSGAAALTAAALLSACGGGGGGAFTGGSAPGGTGAQASAMSEIEAARFLAQAAFGGTRVDIASVQSLGYAGWLDDQFAQARSQSHVDWLAAQGYNADTYRNSSAGMDNTLWRKLLSSPDPLRQRVTFALSEILVASLLGVATPFRQFAMANYMDVLESNAFGNYRQLLHDVTLSSAMGYYLTYRGNIKAQPSGSQPDENYARELMQLFTIGLVQLNPDGTPKAGNLETYTQSDVSGLARVWTGWDLDTSGLPSPLPAAVHSRPMVQVGSRYETGAKTFLGSTVAAGASATQAMDSALDTLFNHPNTGPFISRQLIQRLVTSNPSPAYVQRIAAVFADNGSGARGDLRAVVRALLLDAEARDATVSASANWGKLREPVARLVQWARTFGATSVSGLWAVGDLSDPGTRLGQSPLRSPSVFNFFRPGYVPPGTAIATAGLQAPELQITTESSVAGYVNYMQNAIAGAGIGDVRADYGPLLALPDTQSLVNEVNVLLAAGRLSPGTLATAKTALDAMPAATDAGKRNRALAAVLMVLAAPEYLVQK
ncbi:MAG: DUF1800 domain-containing protein [Ramlibacter sp.]